MTKSDDLAGYYFHQGTSTHAYEYLGCQLTKTENAFVYTFRTWAPGAKGVFLLSDFTDWKVGTGFSKITDRGVYECRIESPVSLEGKAYKFRILSAKGSVAKGDPYARQSRGGSDGASVIRCESTFTFHDENWMSRRSERTVSADGVFLPKPINIYEVHFASFCRHEDGSYFTYREMAEKLIPYVKAMGYTHIEFLPLAEYPFDPSWGYQICAFYAPTSRFGDPDDLRYLVDYAHRAGIGVIMDWVPAHFPKDEWGLYEFDGGPLYEYKGKDRQESPSWGTRFFDLGREEIQSFLVSNALYYFREFHFDGLRVDAVSSMIYLDYDRKPGEWFPNPDGTNENREATSFLKKLNTAVFAEYPDALMIAEESTAFAGVTHPVSEGGLGFNLKWNMGYANDLFAYLSDDPVYRKYHHKALNFPIMYAWSENYILPVSHDEVVHGKKSLIDKMFGAYEDKFAEMRSMLLMTMTYPGKKLLFMGTEFAQFREWDFENSLEWFMLDYPKHNEMREYVRALNLFYLSHRELWEVDFSPRGFEWILADAAEQNAIAYRRFDLEGNELITVISFSGAPQTVSLPLPKKGVLKLLFSTGAEGIPASVKAEAVSEPKKKGKTAAKGSVASVSLPPFSGAVFRLQKKLCTANPKPNLLQNHIN